MKRKTYIDSSGTWKQTGPPYKIESLEEVWVEGRLEGEQEEEGKG